MTRHFSHKNAVAETMKGVWEHELSMPAWMRWKTVATKGSRLCSLMEKCSTILQMRSSQHFFNV